MEYAFDFSFAPRYIHVWSKGLFVTVLLSAAVVAVGTCLGGVLVIARKARWWIVRAGAQLYIDVMRAVPALVLLGTTFFCVPILTGWRMSPIATAFLALSLNLSPFAAECIRAGIESIPRVQYDSARVIGFRGWRLYYWIIGPQAVRRTIPALAGQWVTSMKLTSLAATIGVPEIWHVTGQVVTDTSQPIEARIVGALLYVAFVLPALWGVTFLERSFDIKGLGGEKKA